MMEALCVAKELRHQGIPVSCTNLRVLAGQVNTATIQCASTTRASREGAACGTPAAASCASVLTGSTAFFVNTVSLTNLKTLKGTKQIYFALCR